MALIVQKFGGTSVGDVERMKRVAKIIMQARQQGHQVIAVVSAMQGETDRLISLSRAAAVSPHPREYDALIATGEQISATLLSMILIESNCQARSYNATQIPILTDNKHKKANILEISADTLHADLTNNIVPVITGFQGVDEKGNLTTLGRGGSDMSAVAIAAAVKADECQIYTDVEGVYTSDPRVVKKARRLAEITFDEMLELSRLGAKVLQIRAVEYANRHNVPLRVLSTFIDGPGTLITQEKKLPSSIVAGIAYDRNQAKLTLLNLPSRSDHLARLLLAANQANIDIDMMVENVPNAEDRMDFNFTVHQDDYSQALLIAKKIADIQGGHVIGNDNVAKLSVVGMGIQSHAGVASKMFQVLGEEEIPVHLITASDIKICVIIDEKYTELGMRVLHSAFNLDIE